MPAQALIPVVATLVAVSAALGVAFAPTFAFLYGKWANDPQYSHGFLVPVVSAYLFWRSVSAATSPVFGTPRPILAILLFAVAAVFRGFAGGLLFHQLDVAALFLCLIGVALLAGGFRTLRVAGPALAFLIFMVPLPYEFERNLGTPLRLVATQSSTYLLQTIGEPAVAEGNTILLDSHTLEVEDACSGLKMLVTFAAFAVGAVLTLNRTWFERAMVLLGVVPIAIVTNVLRITATGVSYAYAGDSKSTMNFLHDLYGWLMMPVGLGLLALQLWCLTRLVVRDDPAGPLSHSPYGAAP